ncbi:MAG TPA: hypothetical protein PLK30_15465 [Blastocatellia bacterium]|nr:hypothetical protein [Blastocatellia bacterium]
MNKRSIETVLAWFSIAGELIHFAGETAYQIRFGQYLPMLIVDYIAVAVLWLAAWRSLRCRPQSAAGLLCGGWGFTFCLNYITYFGRLQRQQIAAATINGEPASVINILGGLLLISGTAFLLSLWLANPNESRYQ